MATAMKVVLAPDSFKGSISAADAAAALASGWRTVVPDAEIVARPMADGVGDAGLSFGDGAHRCPGAYIAIQETDIFLTKLFALPGLRMVQALTVRLRPEISSYELVGMRLTVS